MKLFFRLFTIASIALATLLITATAAAANGRGEISANLGMIQGSTTFGAQYDKPHDGYDLGGYFIYQTSKDKAGVQLVYQVTSIGGQIKVHAMQSSRADVYIAPGAGLQITKDAPDGTTAAGTAKKSDVTTFGPSMRIGVLIPMTANIKVGLDRLDLVNWFDDRPAAVTTYYTAAVAVGF